METIMLILTIIGTIATVISTVIAVRAKNESQKILLEIKNNNSISANVKNSGTNQGVMAGIVKGGIDGSRN